MGDLLLGIEALQFLKEEGFSVLESRVAKEEEEAVRIAREIGFPITLKISSKRVLHKTEIGGVRTGIIDEGEVRKNFNDLLEQLFISIGKECIEGIIVQESGKGFELTVGIYEDSQFGKVIMFGQGGIYVEALADVTFRLLPIKRKDAKSMIEELSISKALFSPRQNYANLKSVEDFLIKVSDLTMRRPEIKELDLNPVFLAENMKICDARIKLGK